MVFQCNWIPSHGHNSHFNSSIPLNQSNFRTKFKYLNRNISLRWQKFLTNFYLLKLKNKNSWRRCEISSRLTTKIPERWEKLFNFSEVSDTNPRWWWYPMDTPPHAPMTSLRALPASPVTVPNFHYFLLLRVAIGYCHPLPNYCTLAYDLCCQ